MTDYFANWLLSSPIPSIRYLTLRRLLERTEDDTEVQAVRQAMRTDGPIPAILEKQTVNGNWEGERSYYTPKYVSTHWNMMLLVELAADPGDPQLQRGAEHMLSTTPLNWMLIGKFEKPIPSADQYGLSCFWGNLLRYIAYANRADDPRVQPIKDYVARNLHAGGCRCSINAFLPCAWGAARALWGLAALPQRTDSVATAIHAALNFLLESSYQLTAGDYPTPGKIHSQWSKLNFPLFYQADILFILRVLADLNALDHPGAQPALEWLQAQRKADGRWHGTNPFRARTWKALGDREDTDRWISLHAALILQQAERQRRAV